MKIPDNCFECPLEANNKCCGTMEKKRVESLDIPTWCPLKELSENMKEDI